MPSMAVIEDFLHQDRLAVVGASDRPQDMAYVVLHELRKRGHTVYPVNHHRDTLEGERCYASVEDIPEPVGGAMVFVNAAAAADVVRQCAEAHIPRVWLHKGLGPSSVSDEAVQLCRDNHIAVVDGACAMMFLEPVAMFHRVHRGARRMHHALTA